jgi:amino-acid N-acetyltransferase
MRLRELTRADTPAVHSLLRACRLPIDGVPDDAAAFLVAESDGRVVGCAGLERHGPDALLRSVAVAVERRGARVASELCDLAEERALGLGVRKLFLLTETAERFFARRAYARLDRALAPPHIAASRELAGVCPQSAVLMCREL